VRDVLPSEIWEHYGQIHAYDGVLEWAPIETVHALRIEGKRLRYLLEFFSQALGPGLAKAIDALVALQDHIGELHDVDVTVKLLQDFLVRDARASLSPAVAQAVGRYLKREQARLRTLQRTLKRPWTRVSGAWLRRALGRAVASL
jgi:CHAD domain-containing protein